jgi:hypothetical protein
VEEAAGHGEAAHKEEAEAERAAREADPDAGCGSDA